jgi:uncharacterized protein YvpB
LDQIDENRRRPRIDTSDHGRQGFVTCTNRGVVVWRGPMSKFAEATGFEIVHCHGEDVDEVRRILSGGTPKKVR